MHKRTPRLHSGSTLISARLETQGLSQTISTRTCQSATIVRIFVKTEIQGNDFQGFAAGLRLLPALKLLRTQHLLIVLANTCPAYDEVARECNFYIIVAKIEANSPVPVNWSLCQPSKSL